MLVLSRKQGESIELPTLGVKVQILGLKKSRVELGIEAPIEIPIVRSEQSQTRTTPRQGQPEVPTAGSGAPLVDQFSRLESQIAALAELAGEHDLSLAREVASESLARLSEIKQSLGLATRHRLDAKPISEFVMVRSEVLELLRRNQQRQPQPPSQTPWTNSSRTPRCVRQSNAGYGIGRPDSLQEQPQPLSLA